MSTTEGRPREQATNERSPEPHRPRDLYREFLDAADRYLAEQPTARTVRAAGRHLHAGLIGLVDDVAGRKPC